MKITFLSSCGIEELPNDYTLLNLIEIWSKTSKKKNNDLETRPNENEPLVSDNQISYPYSNIKNTIEKCSNSFKNALIEISVISATAASFLASCVRATIEIALAIVLPLIHLIAIISVLCWCSIVGALCFLCVLWFIYCTLPISIPLVCICISMYK